MAEDGVIRNKTRLHIVPRHQLIDLNKEYINFEIFFECRSIDATKDFEMLVINQDQLNTIDLSNLVMKKTKGGYISGNIVADENTYQNYFLVVKSVGEEPVDADLDVAIRPIEPRTMDAPPIAPTDDAIISPPCASSTSYEWIQKHPFYILIAVVLLVLIIYVGYTMYKKHVSHKLIEEDAASVHSKDSSSSSSSSSEGTLRDLIHKSKNKSA